MLRHGTGEACGAEDWAGLSHASPARTGYTVRAGDSQSPAQAEGTKVDWPGLLGQRLAEAMKLVSSVSIECLPAPCPSPLARKMLRHLLPTQPSARERDKATGKSRELWDTGAIMAGQGGPPGRRGT